MIASTPAVTHAGIDHRRAGPYCHHMFAAQPETRKTIDAATTVVDATVDPIELAVIARDAVDDAETYTKIIAQIPPIKLLARTPYRVVSGGRCGLELLGARGGHSSLIRNEKNPALWAHVEMSGYRGRTTWYRRAADGTFEALS